MIPGLEPVPLKDLQALGTSRVWEVDGQLDSMPSLTPVRGTIRAEHRGNLLEVEGSSEKYKTSRRLCDYPSDEYMFILSIEKPTNAYPNIFVGELVICHFRQDCNQRDIRQRSKKDSDF